MDALTLNFQLVRVETCSATALCWLDRSCAAFQAPDTLWLLPLSWREGLQPLRRHELSQGLLEQPHQRIHVHVLRATSRMLC